MTKPIQTINRYKADLREFSFLLFEQFKLDELLGKAPYEAWGEEEVRASLAECYRFAREVLGPLNVVGDIAGLPARERQRHHADRLQGRVEEALRGRLEVDRASAPSTAAQARPRTLQVARRGDPLAARTRRSTCTRASRYGAAEVIEHFGTAEQKKRLLPSTCSAASGAARCASPSRTPAPTSARAKTTATRNADGSYTIRGTKIFISGGDHDLAENIIHLVLARVDGAPAGTKGLSLFIVPKLARQRRRHARRARTTSPSARIEHKMGINGSATCVLNFGDNGKCIGGPVGGEEKLNRACRRCSS